MTRPVSEWPRSWSWSYTFGLDPGLGLAALVLGLVFDLTASTVALQKGGQIM